jgi:hypothetical protein
MTAPALLQAAQPAAAPAARGVGLSLFVVATAQLMLVLDDTVANIDLPSIPTRSCRPSV